MNSSVVNPAVRNRNKNSLKHRNNLTVSVAATEQEVSQCLQLRYQVFCEEMGARPDTFCNGIETDYFDAYVRHLIVTDNSTNRVVAATRLLSSKSARMSGRFYSETEFNIDSILKLNASLLEVGRTCVAKSHRNGTALNLLWRGVMRIAAIDDADYLFGCASIPVDATFSYVNSICDYLRANYYADESLRVYPKRPLPSMDASKKIDVIVPPLLKTYIRMGGQICGEACYDPDFNVADVFILMQRDNLIKRFPPLSVNA